MRDDEQRPISVQQAKLLFADWAKIPAIVLAVSGGPDSLALMVLAARWRAALKRGPELIAVTIDHGLREASAREARDVKKLAGNLGLPHKTLRWRGDKPTSGIPAAARAARYALLAKAARSTGATHIFTAHTRDDQAETVLMRLSRGSGLAGLAAMARQSERCGLQLARPLLGIAKSQLIATLAKARIEFAVDPSNSDPRFTRPRLRRLMAAFAEEGCDSRNLARLAARLRRANEALEILVDSAERSLASDGGGAGWVAGSFAALPAEIRLRLLLRGIDRLGHEGPAELGKVEALLQELDDAIAKTATKRGENRLKRTLAGALITLAGGRLRIEPAPPRRPRTR
uniref:tRNA(Ile)-lysidine synthase n=1 Tax=Rhodopseudomonas palustris (strain BisA53) TaxID=316055 RepID=Q07HG5_RHOP5